MRDQGKANQRMTSEVYLLEHNTLVSTPVSCEARHGKVCGELGQLGSKGMAPSARSHTSIPERTISCINTRSAAFPYFCTGEKTLLRDFGLRLMLSIQFEIEDLPVVLASVRSLEGN